MAQREWLEKDYYAVLGVSEDADGDTITKAYKRLARQYHPDANTDDPNAEQRFKEVGEAYGVIGDPDTRKEYDQLRRLGAAGFTGGPGGFGGFGAEDLGGFEDILRTVFTTSGDPTNFGRRAHRARRGRDLRADVHLSFEDALAGVRTTLRVRSDGPCETCAGSGAAPGTQPVTCTRCEGRGQITVDQGPFSIAQPCPTCGGRGRTIPSPCPTCSGSGRVVRPRDLTVNLPGGVRDGATIRLPRRGEPGQDGGPPGDVLVSVHVEPHPLFGRKGDHVTLEVPISYAEATLGTKLTLPTPDGGTSTIRIPSGTTSGRTFRVRGKGAPARGGRMGDLLVTMRVEIPRKLSKDQRKLVEQLAEFDDTAERDRVLGTAAESRS